MSDIPAAPDESRRSFLKDFALLGATATALGNPASALAAKAPALAAGPVRAVAEPLSGGRPGSDYMVDVLKSLDIEYVAVLPGSSFRGLHESVINYGGNAKPELLTCLHEESSVALAHGYARAAGKPMAIMMHAAVGLMHGVMSIYGVFSDRVPILMITANVGDATLRRPGVEWNHSAQDMGATVRDFTKWDDYPRSLRHFAESAVRGYKLSTMVPMGPVLIVADGALQEGPIGADQQLEIPRLTPAAPPEGDDASVQELARLLVASEAPVIVADRYARTEAGLPLLIELAELLQAPVVDRGTRFNFPTDHPLNHSYRSGAVIAQADLIVALEPVDLWGALNHFYDRAVRVDAPATKPDVRVVTLGTEDLDLKANYQNFQRYVGANLGINGDAEATMPLLIDEVRRRIGGRQRSAYIRRGKDLAASFQALRAQDREAAALGWDASPISTARLCMEVLNAVKDNEWSLATAAFSLSNWPQRLWPMHKPYHYAARGAGDLGHAVGYATGVALANRGHNRITINLQCDGDLMCAPGILWTAAHHKIPLLTVMHNNRSYHQEMMHVQTMAGRHHRGIDRAGIGTSISEPDIDYARLAQSMGVWAEGPIASPKELAPALARAVAVVKRGEPALVDVVTQPR